MHRAHRVREQRGEGPEVRAYGSNEGGEDRGVRSIPVEDTWRKGRRNGRWVHAPRGEGNACLVVDV
jgi:hypothetical protein